MPYPLKILDSKGFVTHRSACKDECVEQFILHIFKELKPGIYSILVYEKPYQFLVGKKAFVIYGDYGLSLWEID